MQRKATVIIVSSDGFSNTKRSFESVCETSSLVDRVIIADCGSKDQEMLDWLNFVDNKLINGISVKVIFRPVNDGFSSAANDAVTIAESEIIVLAHNDTVFCSNSLDNLIRAASARSDDRFVINPVTDLSYSASFIGFIGRGRYESSMDCSSTESIESWVLEYQESNKEECRRIGQLSSFVLAIRRSFAEKIISDDRFLFDPSYGLGPFEDIDLGRRVQRLGGSIEACLASYVRHDGKATWRAKGQEFRHKAEENEKLFRKKWDKPANFFAVIMAENTGNLNSCLEELSEYCAGALIADMTGATKDIFSSLPKRLRGLVKGVYKAAGKEPAEVKRSLLDKAKDHDPDWIIDISADESFGKKFGPLAQIIANPIDASVSSYLVKTCFLCGSGDVYRSDGDFSQKYRVAVYRAEKKPSDDGFDIEGTSFIDIRLRNLSFLNKKFSGLPDNRDLKLKCWFEDKKEPTVSLVMIVKDETDQLERCLKSASGLYDELIVVWSGSNPLTRQILEKYSARVVKHRWNGDFSFARNKGVRLASMEWIFWLDADEYLSKSSVADWKRVLKEKEEMEVLALKIDVDAASKERLRWYYTRAFRNFMGIKFSGKVHEVVKLPKYYSAASEPLEVFHSGYNDPNTLNEKKERNLKILKKLLKQERDPRKLCYYNRYLVSENRCEEAIELFEDYIHDKRNKLSGTFRVLAYSYAAECYMTLGRLDEALKCASVLMAENNLIGEPYLIMAKVYLEKNMLDNAIIALESLIKVCGLGLKHEPMYNETKNLVTPLVLLAWAFLKKGQISASKKYIALLASLGLNNADADLLVKKYEEYFGLIKDIPNLDDLIRLPEPVAEPLGSGCMTRQARLFPVEYKGASVSVRLNKLELNCAPHRKAHDIIGLKKER